MPPNTLPNPSLLRMALLADAAGCAVSGLALVATAGALAAPFGLPEALLRGVGLGLLPWAAGIAWLGLQPTPSRRFVLAVVVLNAIWVLDSLLLAAGAFGPAPTPLGNAAILAQAALGGGFAALQWLGLRRAESFA